MTRTAPELYPNLVLDPTVQPISRRIVDAVVHAIKNGSLVEADPLPSTRRFADLHGIARSCVVEAYETLCGLGICQAVHGSGTRVAPGALARLTGQTDSETTDYESASAGNRSSVTMTVPFGVGSSVINVRDWNRAWRDATSPTALGTGHEILQKALADHLRSFRGVVIDPRQLVLRPGLGTAIADVVHGLKLSGGSVAIEDPSYPRLQRLFLSEGCRVHCIPVDDEGLRIDLLNPTDRCIHITPARQWPTGQPMSMARRKALLEWSRRTGAVIIENDLDAEFTYGQAPLPTLYSMAAAESASSQKAVGNPKLAGNARVIYFGSSSKLVSPELSITWLVVDNDFQRRAPDIAPISEFPARALAHYLQSGSWYRHRNRAVALFSERREAMLKALQSNAPEVRASGYELGTDLVLNLPTNVDEFVVQMRLEDAGFRVSTVGDFAVRRHQQAIVVRYGDITPMQSRQFAAALHQIVSKLLSEHQARSTASSRQNSSTLRNPCNAVPSSAWIGNPGGSRDGRQD